MTRPVSRRRMLARRAGKALLWGVLAGLIIALVGGIAVTVYNSAQTLNGVRSNLAAVHQLQTANSNRLNAQVSGLQGQVAGLQTQIGDLEQQLRVDGQSISGLAGANTQLARALGADIRQLQALGLRPAAPQPSTPSTTTVPSSTPPTSVAKKAKPKPTTTTSTCSFLQPLLGHC